MLKVRVFFKGGLRVSFKMNNIARYFSNILNFSPNLLTNDMTIVIYGGYKAIISGYKKILVYDDSMLIVCDKDRQLKILGSGLILSEMSEDELIVKGNIKSTELEDRRRGK